jgi:hypothetical protein
MFLDNRTIHGSHHKYNTIAHSTHVHIQEPREIRRIETKQVSEKYQPVLLYLNASMYVVCVVCVCGIFLMCCLFKYGVCTVHLFQYNNKSETAYNSHQLVSEPAIKQYSSIPWCTFLFKYKLCTIFNIHNNFYYTHNTHAHNTHTHTQ